MMLLVLLLLCKSSDTASLFSANYYEIYGRNLGDNRCIAIRDNLHGTNTVI